VDNSTLTPKRKNKKKASGLHPLDPQKEKMEAYRAASQCMAASPEHALLSQTGI
jgi:hypothetical protein